MRAALVAALLALPALVHAEPSFPTLGVWKNTVKNKGVTGSAFTPVSHVLYLNDCKPNGCVVKAGAQSGTDDSRTNTSSIAESQRTLSAFPYGYWDELVACVQDTFAPFDIQITTQDPGTAPHFEVMIGGTPQQLSSDPFLAGAGGVAPFIDCSTTQDNVISFVFAEVVNNLPFLCGAVAQEAAHVWGLDHELNPDDPMTYLELGSDKRFQNTASQCGEYLEGQMPGSDGPRACFCGGPTQNSFAFISSTFDNSNLGPASAMITSPTEGQFVRPGAPIRATLDSQLQFDKGQLSIDGVVVSQLDSAPVATTLPASVAGGSRQITVALTDTGQRTATDSVTVRVLGSCAAGCETGFACLENFCVPGSNVAGGLGASCSNNEECITGTCAIAGEETHCTGACAADGSCPDGFDCLDSNICWPASSGGGCSGSGNPAGFLLIGLGFTVVLLRRGRRS